MPDFTIKEGETLPVFTDTLTYSNGKPAEPESVEFQMRAPTATEALTLSGTSSVVTKAEGKVAFAASGADTKGKAGNYIANWKAKIEGKPMTFPTTGYLWVEVQPSLGVKAEAQLVGLPEVHEHLQIPANDRIHDGTLERYIKACKPLIENLTGPIAIQVHDEWYEGGHTTLGLRHKPSYGYGTNPYLFLMAVSEYRGPIEYNLSVVGTPTQGSVYSTMANNELGYIARRTSGGGTYTFWRDPHHPQQSIHVVYAAGQETVPENVAFAALETIRWWYQTPEAVGKGSLTRADEEPIRPMVALPYHVIAMLEPMRRHPSFA